jgi:hypothetical protein
MSRPGAGFRDRSVNSRYLNDGDDSLCNAHALVTDKSHDIMAACGKFDPDRTGKVSKHDLRRILFNELQIFPSHMDELMKTVDANARGEVVFGEWLANYNRSLPSRRGADAPAEKVTSLRARIDSGIGLRSITHSSSLEKDHLPVQSTTLHARGPSATVHVPSIVDVIQGRRAETQINVAPVREMQLLDEIRALRMPVDKQMQFLRDLPVPADKKIDYFRELQLKPDMEASYVTDLHVTNYLRSTVQHGNPLKRNAEKVLRNTPQRELSLVGQVQRMPLSSASRIALIRDLPTTASKKLDLVHELRCADYVDSLKKTRPIAF